MVPGRHMDQPLVRMASRLHYGELLTAGVRIFEYNRTMMHNKNAVIDGIFSTIGSINFDARSTHENAEESLAFYDRDFGAQLEAIFAEDEKHCREITYESWKKRGIEQRLAELLLGSLQAALLKPGPAGASRLLGRHLPAEASRSAAALGDAATAHAREGIGGRNPTGCPQRRRPPRRVAWESRPSAFPG